MGLKNKAVPMLLGAILVSTSITGVTQASATNDKNIKIAEQSNDKKSDLEKDEAREKEMDKYYIYGEDNKVSLFYDKSIDTKLGYSDDLSKKDYAEYIKKLNKYKSKNDGKIIQSNVTLKFKVSSFLKEYKNANKESDSWLKGTHTQVQKNMTTNKYSVSKLRLGGKVYKIKNGLIYKGGKKVIQKVDLVKVTNKMKELGIPSNVSIKNGKLVDNTGKLLTGQVVETYYDSTKAYYTVVYKGKIVHSVSKTTGYK